MQCDELYGSDYNCEIQRNYTFNSYAPYRTYYPNTQTIYYVPVPRCDERPQEPHREHQINGQRPDIRNKTPRKNDK